MMFEEQNQMAMVAWLMLLQQKQIEEDFGLKQKEQR